MDTSLGPGSRLAGRYRILAALGEGGFGTVYKARDEKQRGKLVAIKMISMVALNAREKIDATDSFNREIMILSTLKHKALPRIHSHFTDPERWYVVMDYIEGQTLEETLPQVPEGRLPVEQVIEIGLALCDVLSYLHSQNPPIIFRDVKPGNIMLTPSGKVYLIDFGIARRYRMGQVRDTANLGSPGYAAPEQYGGMQSMDRTDIYGLGATLQTLLTGKEPLEIRLQGWPLEVAIPWELRALIMQMMEPWPIYRTGSIDQIKEVLSLPQKQGPGPLHYLPHILAAGLLSTTVGAAILWAFPALPHLNLTGLPAYLQLVPVIFFIILLNLIPEKIRGALATRLAKQFSSNPLSVRIIRLTLLRRTIRRRHLSLNKNPQIRKWLYWLCCIPMLIVILISIPCSFLFPGSEKLIPDNLLASLSPFVIHPLVYLIDECAYFVSWLKSVRPSRQRRSTQQQAWRQPTQPLPQQMRMP